jgi:hypothetical protein
MIIEDNTMYCKNCKEMVTHDGGEWVNCHCTGRWDNVDDIPNQWIAVQPCGHPLSAIVQADEGTAFCGSCADDSLRANIAAGVEA